MSEPEKPKDAAEVARNAEVRREHLWKVPPPLVDRGEIHEAVRFPSPQNIAMPEYHAHAIWNAVQGGVGWLQCYFLEDGKCSLDPKTYPDIGPAMVVAKPKPLQPRPEIPGEIVLYPANHIRSYQHTGKRDAIAIVYRDGKVVWWCTQEDMLRYAVTLAKLTGIDEPLLVKREE